MLPQTTRATHSTSAAARVAGTVSLLAAAAVACIVGARVVQRSAADLGRYATLPKWLKVLDDHGPRVLGILHAADLMGERDAVGLTLPEQRATLRYHLMPRPLYIVSQHTPAPDPESIRRYVAQHRRFLERKRIRWLIWQPPDPRTYPRLFDARALLAGRADAGTVLWGRIGHERPTQALDYAIAALVVALVVVLGWAVRPLLFRDAEPMAWPEALPRHFALGLLALYACFSWPMLLGVPLSRAARLGLGLGLIAVLTLLRVLRLPRRRHGAPGPREAERAERRFSLVRGLGLAASVVMVLVVLGRAMVMPVRNGDAMDVWGFAAKVYHYEGGVHSSAYRDPDRGFDFRHYPILVPLTVSTLYSALGRVEDQAAKILFPTFFAMLLLGLHGAMQRERRGAGGVVVLACLAACGAWFRYEGGAPSALGDVPFAFFLLLGLVDWRRWAQSRRRDHLLSWTLLLCGAAVTKREGYMILGAALVLAALLRRRVRPIAWRRVLGGVLAVGLVVVPWYVFAWGIQATWGYPMGGSTLATVSGRLPVWLETVGDLMAEMVAPANWGVLWPLALVAVLAGWRAAPRIHRLVLLLGAFQLGVYLLAYLLTPRDPRALVAVTKMRLLLHLAPIAAYLTWAFLPRLPGVLERPR